MNRKLMLDNFSWIEEKVIAGSSLPHQDSHFDFLEEQGIKIIFNLTTNPTSEKYKEKFQLIHLHIDDFEVPDDELVLKFWNICKNAKENNKPVLVHCFAGCGRTGTILACWLLLSGKTSNPHAAIDKIRNIRPCSIETKDQENFVHSFYERNLSKS